MAKVKHSKPTKKQIRAFIKILRNEKRDLEAKLLEWVIGDTGYSYLVDKDWATILIPRDVRVLDLIDAPRKQKLAMMETRKQPDTALTDVFIRPEFLRGEGESCRSQIGYYYEPQDQPGKFCTGIREKLHDTVEDALIHIFDTGSHLMKMELKGYRG